MLIITQVGQIMPNIEANTHHQPGLSSGQDKVNDHQGQQVVQMPVDKLQIGIAIHKISKDLIRQINRYFYISIY